MTRADVLEQLRALCAAKANKVVSLEAPLELSIGDLGRRIVIGVRLANAPGAVQQVGRSRLASRARRIDIGLRHGDGIVWWPTAWRRRESWGEVSHQQVNTAGLERLLEKIKDEQTNIDPPRRTNLNVEGTAKTDGRDARPPLTATAGRQDARPTSTAPAFEWGALTVERAENLRRALKPARRRGCPTRDRIFALLRERGPLPVHAIMAALDPGRQINFHEMIARGHLRVVGWTNRKEGMGRSRVRVLDIGAMAAKKDEQTNIQHRMLNDEGTAGRQDARPTSTARATNGARA